MASLHLRLQAKWPSFPAVIRLALFDIDGTLIRSGGAGVKAFGRAFEMVFGIPQATAGTSFAGRTDTGLVRELFRRHGIPHTEENAARFFEAYVFWLEHLLNQLNGEICPGVHSFLEQLQKLPEPPVLGLLTGNIRLGAEIKLRHFGLWEPFVLGGFGDDNEDRNLIAAVAQRRGGKHLGRPLTGEEVLVIGDTPLDIACGRAIGAKVLAVTTGGHPMEELAPHRPDWLATDLKSITAETVCLPALAMV